MVMPIVIPVGSLPTAHPICGPRLRHQPEDELVQRRIQRSTRLAQPKPLASGSDAPVSMRIHLEHVALA